MQAEAIGLIDKTIEVLERDGWVKGVYRNAEPEPHCVVGALNVAAFGYHALPALGNVEEWAVYHYTYQRIAEHLGEHTRGHGVLEPEHWNDHVATSKEEVIEMLNHCKFHMLRNAEMVARPWPEVRQTATA